MKYEVIIENNEDGGYGFPAAFLQEVWYAAAQPDRPRHRENGPCTTIFKPDTLERVFEQWQDMGVNHRIGGPSTIWTLDGVKTERWEYRGYMHRLDGPALTAARQSDNCILQEEWFEYDRRHRLDGPAIIHRDPLTTRIVFEAWYKDGCLHRESGPAEMTYDAGTGAVRKSSHYIGGSKRRPTSSKAPAP